MARRCECAIPIHHAPSRPAGGEVQRRESSSADKPEKMLNNIVFWLALLEWAGNAVGTLASIWATVVLLGGFCSDLHPADFWISTVMIFIEAFRVFVRNDASVNQWLFGSPRALRWMDLSLNRKLGRPHEGGELAVIIGMCINLFPVYQPKIVWGILKVALLVIVSQLWIQGVLKIRLGHACGLIIFFLVLAFCNLNTSIADIVRREHSRVESVSVAGVAFWICFGLFNITVQLVAVLFITACMETGETRTDMSGPCHVKRLGFKGFVTALMGVWASLRAIYFQEMFSPYNTFMNTVLLLLGTPATPPGENVSFGPVYRTMDIILHILFFWNLMFPLAGVSGRMSCYVLFPVLAALLIGHLKIPVAVLQVVLSILRLRRLLVPHHDYDPLPEGGSPNMVPSIAVFFMLALFQGSVYVVAGILGIISFFPRRRLVRNSGFKGEWGQKAVDLYFHHAYQIHAEKGLFPSEASLGSFAIECLSSSFCSQSRGCSSREVQLVGVRMLDSFLQRSGCEYKEEIIAEITASTSKKAAASTLIAMLGCTVAQDEDVRLFAARVTAELAGSLKTAEFPGMVKLVATLLDADNLAYSCNGGSADCQTQSELVTIEFNMCRRCCDCDSVIDRFDRWWGTLQNSYRFRQMKKWYRVLRIKRPWQEMKKWWSWTSWSIPPEQTDRDNSLPVLGMRILERLACDPDNCAEIVNDAKNIITKIIGLISNHTERENIVDTQHEEVIRQSLCFLRSLAITGGKIGATFRQELWENPFLLDSLQCILDMKDRRLKLWEPVMDIIAKLALDEVARQEIGSNQAIIGKLMCAFLRPQDVNPGDNNDHSLQMAAGEALANLTIMSEDNCRAILEEPGHGTLIQDLIDMLDTDYICVAADLLHNLCAHSRDKLTDGRAYINLKSAMPKVMGDILTHEDKRLEAVLCVASQIGYVIPAGWFANEAQLVKKLVDTLNSNRKPCPSYPRMRRFVVELVISIVKSCPHQYKKTFGKHGPMNDALDMVKRTPSRLEKYRVFLGGEGVVAESSPMHVLVDEAKALIS
ncbi:hypothetical protein ACP70R_002913 [Stipagrostis hirtigluma subsp. patula]